MFVRCFHLLVLLPLLLLVQNPAPLAARANWGAPFLRHPAVSPDGRTVAFSYAGDIWTVPSSGGTARRITVNPAYDANPVWSPDGAGIAFSSDRAGQDDVFAIDTAGAGEPVQLTFHGSPDLPVGWTPDGSEVIFLAVRELSPRRIATPYRVPADGSRMPVKLWRVLAMHAAVSPDGGTYAFTRGYSPWYRKHYRGSGNYDIWLYNPSDSTYRQFTGSDASEINPMFAGQDSRLYYVSERDGAFNLYRKALDSSPDEPGEQLTSFTEDGIRRSAISADGSTVVFSRGTDFFVMSLGPSGDPRRLEVRLPADTRQNEIAWETFTRDAESFAVSADEKQAAVIVRGELFVVETVEDGITRRISTTVNREADPVWMPDSTTLLFTSDSAGSQDIYKITGADSSRPELYRARHFKLERLTSGLQDEHHPQPSPDGKRIAYVRGRGDLMLMNTDGSGQRALIAGWDEPKFCWSPDSRWIAFSRNDIEFNEDVWIIPADGSAEPANVTRHPDADTDPVWSADGRKLGFRSRRSGENNVDIYFLFLRKDDRELSGEQRRWREQDEEKKEDDEEKDSVPTVRIDFERLHERIVRVSSLPGDEGAPAISPDGKTFAFGASTDGESDLYSVSWDGEDLTRLTTGGHSPSAVRYSPDGTTIYYLRSGGRPHKLTVSDKKSESLPLAARMDIDNRAERRQVFLEGWRALNDYFYDPDFHGADWTAMRDKYLPAVEAGIPAREDFEALIHLMLGELNASHLGFSSSNDRRAIPVGALGVRLDESYSGPGFMIADVLARGPADREQSRLVPGDVITSVAGQSVGPGDNLYHLLYDTVDKPVLLTVRSPAGREREIQIRPTTIGAQNNLVYHDWVDSRRAMVDSLSGRRLGYIHIRAMGWDSFEAFERDLYSECHAKDALVVDVRNNPGGWITDYLLAVLTVRRHARTVPRGAENSGYPQDRLPVYSWVKPVAALCNELSFSNAEIFAHAFKTLDLGPLIGQTTGGAVISTGATRLIDGSVFRLPFRGWYVQGSDINMERQGAVPDIIVPEPPGEEGSGADIQLERAVRELLGRIK
ncbi:MAG: peptidase S41 [Candidatus Glassbacteria bacterium]|nr:peptidase S41 [Candidatus Glassbacteria bacterium]